ncbi:hypothetical protein [Caminibacter pacificus]|uniref:Uncharacterized protein n=2 Tax=Caminibacter pacificus TaxID=1424653 RepID=A0AAJ4UX85_9BACT|nr:hypothetical protein [Caminibacter pacificus]ROR39072.1 hypothetical protein EDC58_1565 [Caminibacter pacificus]
MREFITIRQKAFYEFLSDYNKDKPKEQQIWLDLKDIAIFEYIAQLCTTEHKKIKQSRIIINDTEYTHIAYKKIIEDNPLLNISTKRQMLRIIEKLQKLGLIRKYFALEKGSKTYFTLGHTGLTLTTSMSEVVGHQSPTPFDTNVLPPKTSMSDNSKYNIDSYNSKNKIERIKYIYANLSFFEKKLFILLGNLQKHFETYNLKVNTYKKHLEVFRGLSSKYEEVELITAIYARAIKAIRETSGSQLKTIANPNFLKASMEDLLLEAKEFMEYEDLGEDSIETEFYFMADTGTYLNFYSEIDRYSGEFIDKSGNAINISTLEEDIFLMREYLKQFGIELISEIKSDTLDDAIKNIPYEIMVGRYFHSLLDEELLKHWYGIKTLDDFVNFYNEYLKTKKVNYKDLKLQLMEKVSIK